MQEHRPIYRKTPRSKRLDWELDSNGLNLLVILMFPELDPVFASHRTKIFLHCTNSAFIMPSCRALKVVRTLDEFCLLHPPPLVDLAQPFEVAPFFGQRSPLMSLTLRYFFNKITRFRRIPDAGIQSHDHFLRQAA